MDTVTVNITCVGNLACESAEILVNGSGDVYIECGSHRIRGKHFCRASTINISADTAIMNAFGYGSLRETLTDAIVNAQNVQSRFVECD